MPTTIPVRAIFEGLTHDERSGCVVLKFVDREPMIFWNFDDYMRFMNAANRAAGKWHDKVHPSEPNGFFTSGNGAAPSA